MIKKTPFNYSNDMDRRRQGLDAIVENLLPDVSTDDAGKIVKVSEAGKWTLGDDENTFIEANPDEQPTVDLENLKIGNTVYSVKKPDFSTIKAMKITIDDGGLYCTMLPKIEFIDDGGNVAPLVLNSEYTIASEHSLQYGGLSLTDYPGVSEANTPNTFTVIFINDFNTERYHLIKMTRTSGAFPTDTAKSIKIELSVDGTNFITLCDLNTLVWSDSVLYHIIDIVTGDETKTILPIVTTSDNGKVLGVVSGEWDKMNVPTELPEVTATDNGNILQVVNGAWDKASMPTDTAKKMLVYNCDTPTTLTRDDNGDGSYRYKFVGTVSTAKDENGNDIKSTSSFEVNPNTVIELNLPFGRIILLALQKVSNFSIRFLGVSSQSMQNFIVAFDDIYDANEQLLVNGIAGVAHIASANYRPNNYELTFWFDVYTSDYPIHTP